MGREHFPFMWKGSIQGADKELEREQFLDKLQRKNGSKLRLKLNAAKRREVKIAVAVQCLDGRSTNISTLSLEMIR